MTVFRGVKCPEEQNTMAKSSFSVKKDGKQVPGRLMQVQETGSESSGGGEKHP
jgi:hypothetical protein